MHDHVKVGDVLDVAAPRGSFVLRDGTSPVVLLSAGVGATPVLAMLHALVRQRERAAGVVGARRPQPRRARLRRERSTRSSPRCPTRHRSSPTAGRRRRRRRRLRRRGSPRPRRPRSRRRPEGRRLLRLRTRRLHARDRRRAHGPRRPARARRDRGLRRRRRARLRDRQGRRPRAAPARRRRRYRPDRSRSCAATSPSPGTTGSRTCSTSPRRATCPSASAAAPASATTARAGCSPATCLPHRPARAAARRADPPLLHAADVRADARPVTG